MKNNNKTKQKMFRTEKKFYRRLQSTIEPTIEIRWFIHMLRSGWLVLSCAKVKLFIRIIYVWQSVCSNIFLRVLLVLLLLCWKLYFELRGIAHRNHWNARTDDSYIVCACSKVIAVDSIPPHPFHRLLSQCALLYTAVSAAFPSQTFSFTFSPHPSLAVYSRSFSLYCKVVFPCVTFSQLLMNHPIIGAKYIFHKNSTNWYAFRANADSACAWSVIWKSISSVSLNLRGIERGREGEFPHWLSLCMSVESSLIHPSKQAKQKVQIIDFQCA